jgi:hypothetical protein
VFVLRAIAPIVVVSTVIVFASGVLLLIAGPGGRGELLLVHKASFIIWLPFTGLHVLGHLGTVGRSLGLTGSGSRALTASPGLPARWVVLVAGLLLGLVVAVALVPEFASWTAHGALAQRDH